VVFAHNDFCRHFANPILRPQCELCRSVKPWKRLEQALKTTDLLLHGGGWGVVVFDLGEISWWMRVASS